MKQFLFVLSATLLLILGCKKDDDNDEPSNALTVQNVSGNYKWTGLALSQGIITINLYDSLDNCAKDDVINFKSDKNYTWPDSGAQCTGSQDQNGTWDVSGTDTFIWDGESWDIERWDGKDLEISISDVDSTGQPISVLFKFQKQ